MYSKNGQASKLSPSSPDGNEGMNVLNTSQAVF